jgi:hypothetical protein
MTIGPGTWLHTKIVRNGLVILHIALLQVTATHVLSVIAVVLVILSFLPHSY